MEPLFTCITCHVGFKLAEDQRNHYKSDWHRYNLKRKVADMKPVSQADFELRVQNQQAKQEEEEQRSQFVAYCQPCGKQFGTENAYNNHLNSKRHIENASRPPAPRKERPADEAAAAAPSAPASAAYVDADMTEEEIQQRIDAARKILPHECLFCLHASADFEANMQHMTHAHSLFIPDAEFLTDLEGLIQYLGESIAIGNMCIYCQRGFGSLDAVQKHMIDKGHCRIYFEDDADPGISDFYDFRPSYPDYDPDKPDADIEDTESAPEVDGETMQLVLPGGQRIGHRSLSRYYKQKFKPQDTRASVLVSSLVSQYRALGWHTRSPEEKREVRAHLRQRQAEQMRLGIRTNMLFKARAQMMQF